MSAAQAAPLDTLDLDAPDPSQSLRTYRLLRDYVLMLKQLKGWGCFEGTSGPLRQALNRLRFSYSGSSATTAVGDELATHFRVLVERTNPGTTVPWPELWPAVSVGVAEAIAAAITNETNRQLAALRLREKRFDRRDAFYRLRGFMRVRSHDGCPPTLHWSAPSAVFSIQPWYETDGVPIHTIDLPDVKPSNVGKFRPNVAFQLPPSLANLLNKTSPKQFLDGKGGSQDGLELGWICSFSLPIITLCAFIVLNIFLQLLNIVFWWLFTIKICLPIPRRR
jgi:hypothetical protein